jgi:flagellar biosynthetic protein FliQ
MLTPEMVVTIGQQAMQVTLLISAPILGVGLLVGLLVSIFQAATQLNEMTLSFIPKLFAMFITLVLAGPWMIGTLLDFMRRLYGSIPGLVG